MPTATTFTDLADRAALLAQEHQIHLFEQIEDARHELDLEAGTMTVRPPAGAPWTARVQLLGTAASSSGTWMWGWNNVNNFPERTVEAAVAVHDGTDLPELRTATAPLTDGLADRLVLAAKAVLGSYAHVAPEAAPGTLAYLLVEHPRLELPPPSALRVVRVIGEVLQSGVVTDHRTAVTSYGLARDGVVVLEEPSRVSLVAPDGTVHVDLDDLGRVVSVDGRAGGSGAAGPKQPRRWWRRRR